MGNNIRILHSVPSIAIESAGPTYSIRRLCESLIDRHIDVELISLKSTNDEHLPKFVRTFSGGVGPKKLGRSPAMNKWLSSEAKKNAIDVIHNHSLWMMPNVYPSWVAKKYSIPIVISPRGTLSSVALKSGSKFKKVFWDLIQKDTLSNATCFHATAESELEDIRRLGFKQPVAVIPNGIDLPGYERKLNISRRKLLFLGRIHPIKGLDILLAAWGRIQNRFPDWDLDIVGPDNGGYLSDLNKLVIDLKLSRVNFVGELNGPQKFEAYSSADLFILPSYSENFGVTIAEAYAAGTPAIVTKGTPWEILENRKVGWWVDVTVEAIFEAMKQAMMLPREELEQMGFLGRQLMISSFSWEDVSEKMGQTYQWMVRKDTPPNFLIFE